MATAKTITAFKYRTEVIADITKHTSEFKKADETVAKYGQTVQKVGKETAKAFDGQAVGKKWGSDLGVSAVASIGQSISSMGSTLGTMIGTAIAPGIGTAIGGTVGSAVDTVLGKVAGAVTDLIGRGMELKKVLEDTTVEFTTFAGSEKEAVRYLDDLKKLSGDTGLRMGFLVDTSEHVFDLTNNLKATNLILKAATDQAADFGGKAETVAKIAEVLGLIHEKGELVGKDMKTLYKLGIDAPALLAQATGKSEAYVKRMIAQGRIKGEVAARLISQGIEAQKGGYAAYRADKTTSGLENKASALLEIRSMEGVGNLVRAQRDFLQQEVAALQSETAQKFVAFLDDVSGKMVDMIERGIKTGVRVTGGLAQGILSGESMSTLKGAISTMSGGAMDMLKGYWEIKSPSERTAREIGEPMGKGIGVGMVRRFRGYVQGEGAEEIRRTLEQLLQDPKIKAFLDTIQWAEGGAPNIIVGGKRISDLSNHPNIVGMRTSKGPSTAAGSYQITGSNWYGRGGRPGLQARLGLPDFSAHSQQLAALQMLIDRGALPALQSGNITGAMNVAAKDWTSTPGSKIGGGGQKSLQSWMSHFNQFVGGKAIDSNNPMPVYVVRDIEGGAAQLNRQGLPASTGATRYGGFPVISQEPSPEKEMIVTLGEADAAIVNITDHSRDLIEVNHERDLQLMDMVKLPPAVVAAGLRATEDKARQAMAAIQAQYKFTSEQMEENARQVFGGIGAMVQDAIGQVAGMVPSQQVGKKRSLFSKILGIAAPFLSFIPGAGPILSTIAGAASNISGGNYGAALSGISGGFAKGGVFRSSGSNATGMGNLPFIGSPVGTPHRFALTPRASGGPVRAGVTYLVGERRPELFVPNQNGYIHPNAAAAMSGSDLHAQVATAFERFNALLGRLESTTPHNIVRMGAKGVLSAMDSDAGYANKMGRRLNLA